MIEAKSLQEDRRVLDRSSSDISELLLKENQDKQVLLRVELLRKNSMGDTFGISIKLILFTNDLTITITCSILNFWPEGHSGIL